MKRRKKRKKNEGLKNISEWKAKHLKNFIEQYQLSVETNDPIKVEQFNLDVSKQT